MANVNSVWIANAVANPPVATTSNISVGSLLEASSYATVSASIPSGDTIRLVRVPSNARIAEVLLNTGDAVTAGAIDIGIYETVANGGAAVDADLFASALGLAGGPFNNSDQTFESGEYTYVEAAQPLWQTLGLSADPNKQYDVVATVTTTGNGMGTIIGLKVRYVV